MTVTAESVAGALRAALRGPLSASRGIRSHTATTAPRGPLSARAHQVRQLGASGPRESSRGTGLQQPLSVQLPRRRPAGGIWVTLPAHSRSAARTAPPRIPGGIWSRPAARAAAARPAANAGCRRARTRSGPEGSGCSAVPARGYLVTYPPHLPRPTFEQTPTAIATNPKKPAETRETRIATAAASTRCRPAAGYEQPSNTPTTRNGPPHQVQRGRKTRARAGAITPPERRSFALRRSTR